MNDDADQDKGYKMLKPDILAALEAAGPITLVELIDSLDSEDYISSCYINLEELYDSGDVVKTDNGPGTVLLWEVV